MTDAATVDLATLNARFENADPRETLAWAFAQGDMAIAVSFQIGALSLAHMARDVVDEVPILFIQTGFHFRETLEFRDKVVADWGLRLIETTPTLGPERQAREIHPELYRVDKDRCCELNKVLPLDQVLNGLDGAINGRRRDESETRANLSVIERQILRTGKTIWRVNPLASWTKQDVWRYASENDVPRHPLYEEGYASIGCSPDTCTRPVQPGEDDRDGRWADSDKTECGIFEDDEASLTQVASTVDRV